MSLGILARGRAEREAEAKRRRTAVLQRLRWRAPAGLTERDLAERLGWPVGTGAVLRDLAERGEAHERDGVWYLGTATSTARQGEAASPIVGQGRNPTPVPSARGTMSSAREGTGAREPVSSSSDPGAPAGPDPDALAQRLRAMLAQEGCTQRDLARRIGVGQSAISLASRGRSVGAGVFARIQAWGSGRPPSAAAELELWQRARARRAVARAALSPREVTALLAIDLGP
jgi:transcriptional regulator with XRE-family HTH domain